MALCQLKHQALADPHPFRAMFGMQAQPVGDLLTPATGIGGTLPSITNGDEEQSPEHGGTEHHRDGLDVTPPPKQRQSVKVAGPTRRKSTSTSK